MTHEEFLRRQLVSISQQNADKDWRIAEFYRRTEHPGAAFFYYEIVRRRYPGTKLSELAVERMEEVRAEAEQERAKPRNMFEQARDSWDRLWGNGAKPGSDTFRYPLTWLLAFCRVGAFRDYR